MMRRFLLILILTVVAQGADTELQDIADEMTDIQGTDLLYVVDDPSGTPNSEKITITNLFDLIDTSSELYGILTDETGSGSGSPLAVFNVNPTLIGATLTGILADNDDMIFECDADNDGSNKYSFTNGAGSEVVSITEAGLLSVLVGIDGIGAIGLAYGSDDITGHTFSTDGVGTAEIVLPAGSIDGTEILDDTIDSDDYAAASIDNEHLADDAVDSAELATDAVGVDALDQTISPTLTGRWTFAGEDTGTDVIGLNVNWAGSDPTNGQSEGDLWYDSTLNVYKGYTTHEIILGSAEEPGIIQAKKGSAGTISAGDAVYIAGFDGTDLLVELADADDSSKMPAIGIAAATINSGTAGSVTTFGLLEDIINTGGMSIGDGIWITATGTTGNTLTNTKPTGATTAIQRIATVASSAASGELFVAGALRTNDESNLTEAYIFVGNANEYSTPVAMSGDVAIVANGTTTIQADAVVLTTDTSGNYSNGNAEAGDALVSIAVEITDNENTAENNPIVFVADAAQAGGDLGLESDGTFFYTPSTGTVTTTEFAGGGGSLTSIDAATGDSATAFFDAGTIEHEWGGLQADISAYTGLIGITGADTTVEVDLLSELLTAMGDVTAFITDDDMPAVGNDPDVDGVGEIGRDADDHSLRGWDGSAQYLYAARDKPMQFTIAEPDGLAEADNLVIWTNNTAFSFHITEIQADSGDDNATFTLKEVDADGANVTTIEAVTISTDGTNLYYTTVAVGDIDHKEIEAGHKIMYDATAFDAGYIHVAIEGYFDADVN